MARIQVRCCTEVTRSQSPIPAFTTPAGRNEAGSARRRPNDTSRPCQQSLRSLWRTRLESKTGRRRPSRAGLGLVPGGSGRAPYVPVTSSQAPGSCGGLVYMRHFRRGVWRTRAGFLTSAKTEANRLSATATPQTVLAPGTRLACSQLRSPSRTVISNLKSKPSPRPGEGRDTRVQPWMPSPWSTRFRCQGVRDERRFWLQSLQQHPTPSAPRKARPWP